MDPRAGPTEYPEHSRRAPGNCSAAVRCGRRASRASASRSPSVDYLAVLALIVASGAAAATQVGAFLMFNVVAFAFVEIPLISYLVAPDRTRATLSALQDWLRSRRRRDVAVLLAAVGCVLLGAGLAGL